MTEDTRTCIMTALLKCLYEGRLISGDVYGYVMDKLPAAGGGARSVLTEGEVKRDGGI